MTLSPLDDYPVHQIAETDPPRGHLGSKLLRPLLLQLPCRRRRRHRAAVSHHRSRPVPQSRRVRRLCCSSARRRPHRFRIPWPWAPTVWTCQSARCAIESASRVCNVCGWCSDPSPRSRPELRPHLRCPTAPPMLEARHFHRQLERVTFDTSTLPADRHMVRIADRRRRRHPGRPRRRGGVIATAPGVFDRSAKRNLLDARRIRRSPEVQNFFWIYSIMQFGDFTISVVIQEDEQGTRIVEDATRVWPDVARDNEWLGRPDHATHLLPRHPRGHRSGTHAPSGSPVPGGPTILTSPANRLLANYIGIGTGYGLEQDWRHGMWQGELVVQGLRDKVQTSNRARRCSAPSTTSRPVHPRRRHVTHTGTGLFEVAAIGPHERYGFTGIGDVAP